MVLRITFMKDIPALYLRKMSGKRDEMSGESRWGEKPE